MEKKYFSVAEHLFCVTSTLNIPLDTLLTSYAPFQTEENMQPALFEMLVTRNKNIIMPGDEIGQFDCGGCNHGVYLLPDGGYKFTISNVEGIECCTVVTNKTFTRNTIYILDDKPENISFGINNSIMIAYAFATSSYKTLLIHSSVIRNNGYGYLFLGQSGTGKSTHSKLWLQHIPGSDLMNDDNPIIRVIEGITFVYGSPWSGKTPCYRNIKAPAGAFVQLEQKKENQIRKENVLHSFANLLSSVSVMKWDKEVYNHICDTISAILEKTPVFHLGCLPDKEAAILSHKTIAKE